MTAHPYYDAEDPRTPRPARLLRTCPMMVAMEVPGGVLVWAVPDSDEPFYDFSARVAREAPQGPMTFVPGVRITGDQLTPFDWQ